MKPWISVILFIALSPCASQSVARAQPVIIRISTSGGGLNMTHGHLDSITFTVDANGSEIGRIICPFVITFSNGNIIGEFVAEYWNFYWGSASTVLEDRVLDEQYSMGTDPDTLAFAATNLLANGWTGVAEFAFLMFPPRDTGTIVIDSVRLPSGAHLAAYDMLNNPLEIDWQVDTIRVAQHPDDQYWHTLGSGIDDTVRALITHNGALFAGGDFTSAGGVPASHIARWDGVNWNALGAGTDDRVDALCVYDDDLIASGVFSSAGGMAVNRIARWDGAAWHGLGSGVNDRVTALTVSGGELIAAGPFTEAGGMAASGIARWNGTGWNAIGTGLGSEPFAITVYAGELVAGTESVSQWDGADWQPLSSWISGPIFALAGHKGDLIAGGAFVWMDSSFVGANIARWDGAGWHSLGGGTTGEVNCLSTYNNELIVGGDFLLVGWAGAFRIANWNGSIWQELGSGLRGWSKALTLFNGELIVGGGFSMAGNKLASNIAAWNKPSLNCPIAITGDVNLSGAITSADVITLVNYVFKGGGPPQPCIAAGDVNCNGSVTLADIIILVNYVFKSGPPPCDACTMIPGTWSCP